MLSRRTLAALSVTAGALAFQAATGASRVLAQTPSPPPAQASSQPPKESAAKPRLPTIHVEAGAPRTIKHRRRAPPPAARRLTRSPAAAATAPTSRTVEGTSGPGMGNLGTGAAALPAGSTTLNAAAIAQTPIASYGDIFRSLPGFEVSNYGQGAIGYGLAMRGYTNAEHGRDIAYYIDGVPVNDISSIHTPNYADLNILMPETVQSIEVVRGPFDVECGDSNLGGCVIVTTKNSEPYASVGASGGSYATARGVATYSSQGGDYQPFFVEEGYRTGGYRDNSWIDNYNSFNKISTPLGAGTLSIRGQAYGTTFGAPGYISRDAVLSGGLSPRAAVDTTDGGSKYFENLTANYTSGPDNQNFTATLFTNHDIFDRFADFAPAAPQRLQHDERFTMGGRIRKVWTEETADGTGWQILAGTQWRTDFINAFQAPTIAAAISGPAVENINDTETDIGPYAQVQWKPVSWLKLTGAERFDQFFYNVTDNITPGNSTNISPGIWSPKAGITLIPFKWLDLYANYGEGFRSIDAATELIGNPTIQPFKIESKEVGTHVNIGAVVLHADVYTTHSQNEAFQAAPGLPETLLGAAQRAGYDLDARYYVFRNATNNVSVFGNYGEVVARLLGAAPSYYVPNVPLYVANIGIDYSVVMRNAERLSGSAFVTFVGHQNLTQDGGQTAAPYQRLTGRINYAWPDGWSVFTEAIWYPGSLLSEFAFNLTGPVVGAASSDIYTAPVPRFTVLGGFTYRVPTSGSVLASNNADDMVHK
jgi:outer membrane receptor protein involved in Fe transport